MTNEKVTAKISGLGTVMSGLVKAKGYEQIIDHLPRGDWFKTKDVKGVMYEEYVPERWDRPRHTELTIATPNKIAFVLKMLAESGYAEVRERRTLVEVVKTTRHCPVINNEPYRIDAYDKDGNFIGRIRNPKAKFDYYGKHVEEKEVTVQEKLIKEYRITEIF